MHQWSDDDAPSWRRVKGIGRPLQPTEAGRRGCMLLLVGGLVLIVLAVIAVAIF